MDGVTALVSVDVGPVPRPLVATTANRYGVPLLRPVTVHVLPVPDAGVHPNDPVVLVTV